MYVLSFLVNSMDFVEYSYLDANIYILYQHLSNGSSMSTFCYGREGLKLGLYILCCFNYRCILETKPKNYTYR